MGKRKLLFYSDVYDPICCGLTTSLRRILHSLSHLGQWELHVLTYDHGSIGNSAESEHGITVHRFGCGEYESKELYPISAIQKVTQIHNDIQFDAFIGFYANWPAIIVGMAGQTLSVPYIICCRGSDVNFNIKNPIQREVLKPIFSKASSVACVSSEIADRLILWQLVDKNRICVIENSIDIGPFDEYRKRLQNEDRKWDFLFIANAKPMKRFDMVLDAVDILRNRGKKTSLGALLIPHKTYPNLIESYKKRILECGLNDSVDFLPQIPYGECIKLYFKTKGVIIASEREGCSNVLLESMAAGRYVIVRNTCTKPSFIESYDWTFSTSQELAEKMEEALLKPDPPVEKNIKAILPIASPKNEALKYKTILEQALKQRNT